jgi:hypothetical protein
VAVGGARDVVRVPLGTCCSAWTDMAIPGYDVEASQRPIVACGSAAPRTGCSSMAGE